MIEFLAQMPSDTMIFITTAVLVFCCNADRAEMADLRLCIGGATGPTDKITAVIGDPPKRFGVTECENIDKAQASLKSSGREAIAPQTKKTNMMPIA